MTRSQITLATTLFVAAALALFLSFNFSGDYAVNDDWGYPTPVRWWVVDRQLSLTHWQSMPLISQLFLGVAWAEVFGFRQGALRQLSLVLALTTCAAVFACARALALPDSICLLCALLPLASPLFVDLSYSFMTDVPAAALAALSLLFLIRSFSRPVAADGTTLKVSGFFCWPCCCVRHHWRWYWQSRSCAAWAGGAYP